MEECGNGAVWYLVSIAFGALGASLYWNRSNLTALFREHIKPHI